MAPQRPDFGDTYLVNGVNCAQRRDAGTKEMGRRKLMASSEKHSLSGEAFSTGEVGGWVWLPASRQGWRRSKREGKESQFPNHPSLFFRT